MLFLLFAFLNIDPRLRSFHLNSQGSQQQKHHQMRDFSADRQALKTVTLFTTSNFLAHQVSHWPAVLLTRGWRWEPGGHAKSANGTLFRSSIILAYERVTFSMHHGEMVSGVS